MQGDFDPERGCNEVNMGLGGSNVADGGDSFWSKKLGFETFSDEKFDQMIYSSPPTHVTPMIY